MNAVPKPPTPRASLQLLGVVNAWFPAEERTVENDAWWESLNG